MTIFLLPDQAARLRRQLNAALAHLALLFLALGAMVLVGCLRLDRQQRAERERAVAGWEWVCR